MGLNYRKSIKISKNTRINFSKRGVSFSTGVKGARINIGPRGIRRTIGIPGTGIYTTKQTSWKSLNKNRPMIQPRIKHELPAGVELIKTPRKIVITIAIGIILVIISFFKLIVLPIAFIVLIVGFTMMVTNKEFKLAYFTQRAIMFYQNSDFNKCHEYCKKALKYGNNDSTNNLKEYVEHLV